MYTFLICFFIIMSWYKYDMIKKNNLENCFRNIFFFRCRIIETRQVRLWTFDICINIKVIMVNAVFIVKIPNMDSMINYPFYYKIICSSPFSVKRTTTTRMEYIISFLHEIVWIRSGDNKVTKFKLAFERSPWYQINVRVGILLARG